MEIFLATKESQHDKVQYRQLTFFVRDIVASNNPGRYNSTGSSSPLSSTVTYGT
jgi:hypothetical protein